MDEIVSKISDEERKRLAAEHRAKVASGEIDIGPKPHHEPTDPSIRADRRDPQAIGEKLMEIRRATMPATNGNANGAAYAGVGPSLSALADEHMSALLAVPDVSHNETTVVGTARAYRQELEERAAKGDKFAISMLTTGQPGDSDS